MSDVSHKIVVDENNDDDDDDDDGHEQKISKTIHSTRKIHPFGLYLFMFVL